MNVPNAGDLAAVMGKIAMNIVTRNVSNMNRDIPELIILVLKS